MARVVIENLVKTYPDPKGPGVTAVKGINLTVENGEFMVLVGPSGCGKSTTLRMIAGLEDITGGTVSIDGRVVNDVEPKDRDIAMVFQNYALYPHMSVRDNMAFGLKLRKLPAAEINTRVGEAAALLGLEELLERKPKALSGGQRQRVAVGRAIVRQPKVFLFDEPLSNLDAKMRVQMRAEISKLHARLGATMVYVTHDQVEAMTMGDRICVMHDGVIRQVDEPLALYNRPADLFTAGFIGSPQMNLIKGRVESRVGRPCFVEQDAPAGAPRWSPGKPGLVLPLDQVAAPHITSATGRNIVLGIRPEDIHEQAQPGTVSAIARIELVEPMGAETFVYLRTGAHGLVARFHSHHALKLAAELTVHLNLARARFFDADSQAAL